MTVNIPVTQEIPIEEACTMLDLDPNISDPTWVLSNFKKAWEKDPTTENLILAKHTLIRHIVSTQMKERRYFSVESPFDTTCIACRGTGEIFKFNKLEAVDIRCPVCSGEKEIDGVTCSRCLGNGKIKKAFYDHTLKSTTPCKQCNELGFIIPKKKATKQPYKSPKVTTPVFSQEIAKTLSEILKE